MTTSTGRSIAVATQRAASAAVKPGHAAPLGEQVGDQDDRAAHLRERFAHAADEQRRHQAGEEAAGTDDHCVEVADRLGHRRVDGHLRLEPEPADLVAAPLPGVDFDFAAGPRAVAVLGADRCRLDADRPDAALAAEQAAQPVDGRQEVAAVLLHHRQQQVAAGVAGEAVVLLERRQPRQQDAARFAFVARQRERALQHVAGRQHAELIAQLARTAAAVEHGDDGVQLQPRVASSGRRAGWAGRCRRRSSRCSAHAAASAAILAKSGACLTPVTSRRGDHSEPPSLATHLSHAQPAKATGTMPAMTSTSSATATAAAPLVADLQAVFGDRLRVGGHLRAARRRGRRRSAHLPGAGGDAHGRSTSRPARSWRRAGSGRGSPHR